MGNSEKWRPCAADRMRHSGLGWRAMPAPSDVKSSEKVAEMSSTVGNAERIVRGMRSVLDVVATIVMLSASAAVLVWFLRSGPTPEFPEKDAVAAPNVEIEIGSAPTLGRASAPLVMLLFSDFECPFCRRFAEDILPLLRAEFVDTGKLNLAFLHLPLVSIHSNAAPAANLSTCAQRTGQFWHVHDQLFKEPLTKTRVLQIGTSMGLEAPQLTLCTAPDINDQVQRDVESARRAGIRTTPSVLLGHRSASGAVRVQAAISGARPYGEFKATIRRLLPSR